jgi:hypothetical protein
MLSRYIQPFVRAHVDILIRSQLNAANKEERDMHKNEQRDDQRIDLGVASVETKGGEYQVFDAQQSLSKLTGISTD